LCDRKLAIKWLRFYGDRDDLSLQEDFSMLIRHDPFREFDRFFAPINRTPQAPIDAYRRDDHVFVEVDLPGVQPDSIDVTVERNVLTVRATRAFVHPEGDQFFLRERTDGVITRQLFLGDTLDAGNVTADYANGVLIVSIPVAQQAKPRRIEVSTGVGSAPALDEPVEVASSAS
jgi:HSP20 family protein